MNAPQELHNKSGKEQGLLIAKQLKLLKKNINISPKLLTYFQLLEGLALFEPVENNLLNFFEQWLLHKETDPTENDNYAIRWAAQYGYLEIVQLLLKIPDVDPTADDNDAIQYAAANGHVEVVKLLLTIPHVDPTANDNFAIRWAAGEGYVEVVRLLLTIPKVDPTAVNNYAIRYAAACDHVEVVRLLLTIPNVDPTADDNFAIREAALQGSVEVVRLLLTIPNVDPTAHDNHAIKAAAGFGHKEVVVLLATRNGFFHPSANAMVSLLEKDHKDVANHLKKELEIRQKWPFFLKLESQFNLTKDVKNYMENIFITVMKN